MIGFVGKDYFVSMNDGTLILGLIMFAQNGAEIDIGNNTHIGRGINTSHSIFSKEDQGQGVYMKIVIFVFFVGNFTIRTDSHMLSVLFSYQF